MLLDQSELILPFWKVTWDLSFLGVLGRQGEQKSISLGAELWPGAQRGGVSKREVGTEKGSKCVCTHLHTHTHTHTPERKQQNYRGSSPGSGLP